MNKLIIWIVLSLSLGWNAINSYHLVKHELWLGEHVQILSTVMHKLFGHLAIDPTRSQTEQVLQQMREGQR